VKRANTDQRIDSLPSPHQWWQFYG